MSIVSVNNSVVALNDSCHKISNVDGINLFLSHGSAWHSLGMELDTLFDLETIREVLPALLYTIKHVPCFAQIAGQLTQITDVNAIVMQMQREDGTTFEKFFESRSAKDTRPIIQPEETLQLFEDVFSKYGAKFSTVGSLYNGETFFVSAKLPSGFSVCGDEHSLHLNAIDNYTGENSLNVFDSSTRIVCNNTAKIAMGESREMRKLKHTGDLKNRLAEIVASFDGMIARQPAAIELLRQSTKVQIAPNVAINRVLDAVFGAPGLNINVLASEMQNVEQSAKNRLESAKMTGSDNLAKMQILLGKQVIKRQRVFDDILGRYFSATCENERGTAYSAYQACTEYANFGIGSKKTDRQVGNDFLSLANGKGATLTDAAWNTLIVAV